jgi:hypothetical protein
LNDEVLPLSLKTVKKPLVDRSPSSLRKGGLRLEDCCKIKRSVLIIFDNSRKFQKRLYRKDCILTEREVYFDPVGVCDKKAV